MEIKYQTFLGAEKEINFTDFCKENGVDYYSDNVSKMKTQIENSLRFTEAMMDILYEKNIFSKQDIRQIFENINNFSVKNFHIDGEKNVQTSEKENCNLEFFKENYRDNICTIYSVSSISENTGENDYDKIQEKIESDHCAGFDEVKIGHDKDYCIINQHTKQFMWIEYGDASIFENKIKKFNI